MGQEEVAKQRTSEVAASARETTAAAASRAKETAASVAESAKETAESIAQRTKEACAWNISTSYSCVLAFSAKQMSYRMIITST